MTNVPAARVLVVDDEKLIRWSVAERLQRGGYEVLSAETGELYAARVARFREVALKRGPGIDPEVVAKTVEHALTARRPKARYLVGKDAHLRAWIERLPTRLRDRVLARALTE